MTAALAGSLVLNPLGTLGALAGGTVGGKAVDKASQAFTGKTWAENVVDRLGLQTPTLAEFTNPGMWVGGYYVPKYGTNVTRRGVETAMRTSPM